jgi:hypothetical protein
MEVEVAPVRMNDRVEPYDGGLSSDGSISEPQDDVVDLIEDSFLHFFVGIGARRGIDNAARLLREFVDDRVLDSAIVESPGRIPQTVVKKIRLP